MDVLTIVKAGTIDLPMKYKLSLKAAYSHDGLEYGTGPAILYKIQGLPEGENLLLRNVRPRFREGEWQVGDHWNGYQVDGYLQDG
jgi:hypothetical protein